MALWRIILAVLAQTAGLGCATHGAVCAAKAAPQAAADPNAGVAGNHINPALLRAVERTLLIDHLKLKVTANGDLDEFEIYHHDPSPISAAVKQLVKSEFPDAHVLNYETAWEAEVGAVTEVEVKTAEGRLCELNATANGDLRFVRCDIDLAELPDVVSQTVRTELPTGTLIEAQYREGPAGEQYLVIVRVGSQLQVLRTDIKGAVLSRGLRVPAIVFIEH